MLFTIKQKQVHKRLIGKVILAGLEENLNDPKEGFVSYVHAQEWVNENYNTNINYYTLRSYMIDVFGTKIKRPRK